MIFFTKTISNLKYKSPSYCCLQCESNWVPSFPRVACIQAILQFVSFYDRASINSIGPIPYCLLYTSRLQCTVSCCALKLPIGAVRKILQNNIFYKMDPIIKKLKKKMLFPKLHLISDFTLNAWLYSLTSFYRLLWCINSCWINLL